MMKRKNILYVLFFFFMVILGVPIALALTSCSATRPTICTKYEHRCEDNMIQVCTGPEWMEIQNCSDFVEGKFYCTSEDDAFFCEEVKE